MSDTTQVRELEERVENLEVLAAGILRAIEQLDENKSVREPSKNNRLKKPMQGGC